jgi:hypothetical protein
MFRVNDTGRRLQGSDYPEDDGTVTEEVAAALSAYAAGSADHAAALAALAEARVLVPVVAVLGEVEHDEAGLARDKTSDMAAVLLTGADGRLALLAFTSTSAMAAWDPAARPVPVATRLAAQTALQEGAAALVVDVAGPVTVVAQGDDLHGLAAGWGVGRVGEQPVWIRPAGE